MAVLDTCFLVPGITRAQCASWVQAWGSIAAIVAAATVVFVQHMLERRRDALKQREADRRLLTIARSVAHDAQDAAYRIGSFRSTESLTETAQHREGWRNDIELAVQSVRAVFLMQLPTASAVTAVVRVQGELQRGLKLVDAIREVTSTPTEFPVACGRDYGQPWLSVHANIKDQVAFLEWELRRLDNPAEPHPTD